jgi:thiamine-monophosphate kinase
MSETRTELSSLGEFGWIDRISKNITLRQPGTKLGIGDDAAAFEVPKGELCLVSTDMLLEGIHFDLGFTPLHLLGYKAVAVNLSDIAAMNAVPRQILVSIGISNRFSLEALDALYLGIEQACKEYHVDLIGGDTSASRTGLLLSITAIGTQKPEKIVRRSGAKPGDLLCVSGDLGAAYAGLQILSREKKVFEVDPDMQPELKEEHAYLIGRQLKAEARTDIVHEMEEKGLIPTAMMDVSDGLASEILHLSKQSGVAFHVFEEKIPIENQTKLTASEFGLSPLTCALNGGEDYELVFTVSQADYPKVNAMEDVSIIGVAREADQGNRLILKSGQIVDITAQGWTHF